MTAMQLYLSCRNVALTPVMPEFREAKYPAPRAAPASPGQPGAPGPRLCALTRSGRDDSNAGFRRLSCRNFALTLSCRNFAKRNIRHPEPRLHLPDSLGPLGPGSRAAPSAGMTLRLPPWPHARRRQRQTRHIAPQPIDGAAALAGAAARAGDDVEVAQVLAAEAQARH